METKNMLTGFMAIALLALPAVSLANTYHFIDTSGNRQSMEASSFDEALASAPLKDIRSGVMLIGQGGQGGLSVSMMIAANNPDSSPGNYYRFIDTSGDLRTVWAVDASTALAVAPYIGIHSGVMLVR